MEERGAGGGTVRLWIAVPSPGHKKSEKFKLNQEIAKFLSFKKASPPVENSRKIRKTAC